VHNILRKLLQQRPTMRYVPVFLAIMAGTVFGDEIDVTLTGITVAEDFCSTTVLDALFKECVVETAERLGAVFHHGGRELRGSRNLPSCAVCPPDPPKGHWCYVMCSNRRRLTSLAILDPVKLVVNQGQIQSEARRCYQDKAAIPDYYCLGVSDDIKIKVGFTKT
jgi:hypothetical protein